MKVLKSKKIDSRIKAKYSDYEYVKSYPHFDLYREVKSGYYECFKREDVERNENDNINNIYNV